MNLDPVRYGFRGDGIVIRPWWRGDIDVLYEAARESIPTVGRWLPWCHENYARADSEAWIEHCATAWNAGEQYAFAIADEDESRILGGVGLNKFDPARQTANLGYWVRASAERQGIATQAVQLVSAFGFATGFTQFEIVAALDNIASRRVAEKSGTVFQRTERGRIHFREQKLDAAIYALLPPAQNRS
ncbi:MAG: N-acetyltransferase [Rhodanobacteraceae bacterium]